ncbi:MAG: S1 RNA-binding domain-containing protein [Chitinophagaceae bacterium]|nr:S1 RNA-binding domain-containing protein [Anaerolineae bacterium]
MMPSAEDQLTPEVPSSSDAGSDAETSSNTQARSDALAAAASLESVPEEALVDAVDNINTDPNLSADDAGELSASPSAEVESDDDEVAAGTPEDEFVAAMDAPDSGQPRLKRGELIQGKIIKTTPTSIEIDIGLPMEGIIPRRELEQMTRQQLESLVEGQEITVFVINPNDHKGNVVLSLNRAAEELDWQEAETYRASQEVYEGNIAGYNKGGLIVRFGRLRGFVPQSQISDDRRRAMEGETPEDRYGAMVNEHINVKVMEVDRSRNRLILSERAATRENREKRKEALINELTVGQIFEGRVVSLEDFGAFVDIGGAEGLVHLTEISWKHVTHPKDVLKVGQRVRVEVIGVDRDRKRIGLSIKRQEADPWDEIATTYGQGFLVQATVTKLTKFGAFARLVEAPDIEGLIHISELSEQRVVHPREVVEEGEKLTLRVVKVDVKNRRLGLSLKRVNSAEYLDVDMLNYGSSASDEPAISASDEPSISDDDEILTNASDEGSINDSDEILPSTNDEPSINDGDEILISADDEPSISDETSEEA